MLQSALGFVAEPEAAGSRRNRTAAAAEEECYDLPARLMRALLAGAENGEGDSRCTRREPPVPVDSAYIRVDLPTGEPWLLLSVVDTYPLSAVDVLHAAPMQVGVGQSSAAPDPLFRLNTAMFTLRAW